jgi:hypothetical protein
MDQAKLFLHVLQTTGWKSKPAKVTCQRPTVVAESRRCMAVSISPVRRTGKDRTEHVFHVTGRLLAARRPLLPKL